MPSFRSLRAALMSILLVLVLAACGGGGGGPDPVCISFEQARVVGTFVQAQQKDVNADQDPNVVVTFDATGPIEGQAYVYVVDTANVFDAFPVSVVPIGPGRYELTLRVSSSLPAGAYRGTFEVRLCKDLQCSTEYAVSGGVLAYAMTVVPQLAVTVYLDEVAQGTATSATFQPVMVVAAGNRRLRVTSNVPIVVNYESVPGSHEFVVDPTSTTTDWRADVVLDSPQSSGALIHIQSADSSITTERPVAVYVEF